MKQLLILLSLYATTAWAQGVVHSRIGQTDQAADGSVRLTLLHKFQSFSTGDRQTYDADIHSPKSVNIHPSGKKFYVNSLEGFCTVVYEMGTWKKLKVIHHQFDDSHRTLWAKPSGLFPFRHYNNGSRALNTFSGKPVESTFTHGGRYLWVPYYRRSYDINAQDPSAMAVIDTDRDTIVRLFETGPLPKMVASSHDGRTVAISHWGDNTVATLDISGDDPASWHYDQLYIVDYQLKLNFSLSESVNRDNGSGYALRGTVFTPDDNYLLVGCMGGAGGIAVIDLKAKKYMGRMLGMRANIRHLVIKNDTLYLSSNAAGVIQRMPLSKFMDAARQMQGKTATVSGWEECTVMSGARTIEASPSGRFFFAACNGGSRLCVADTRSMKMVCSTPVDSYPVGLDISDDGSIVIVTSQGHSGSGGGNAVNIYSVEYAEAEVAPKPAEPAEEVVETDTVATPAPAKEKTSSIPSPTILLWVAGISMVIMLILIFIQKHRQQ
ncbi:MAG: hypothetical protein K5778_08315 [Bacteroidaceae bacterium]|nr:hypothetical protein [Bacteroidaceae bacterium]